jgi:hypothetical protein
MRHFLAVGTVSNGSIFTSSSRFRLFWVLEAVRAKTKETVVGITVAYMAYINTLEALFTLNRACMAFFSRWNRFQRLYFHDSEPISPILGLGGR